MTRWTEAARERRKIYDTAITHIPETEALNFVELFSSLTGDGSLVKAGERRLYDGKLYRANVDLWDTAQNTPAAAPSLWVEIKNPGSEYPDWIQPAGGHDAYKIGDKVTHKGSQWISNAASNVWEPGVHGWDKVT